MGLHGLLQGKLYILDFILMVNIGTQVACVANKSEKMRRERKVNF
jgi:hypothetical protein